MKVLYTMTWPTVSYTFLKENAMQSLRWFCSTSLMSGKLHPYMTKTRRTTIKYKDTVRSKSVKECAVTQPVQRIQDVPIPYCSLQGNLFVCCLCYCKIGPFLSCQCHQWCCCMKQFFTEGDKLGRGGGVTGHFSHLTSLLYFYSRHFKFKMP